MPNYILIVLLLTITACGPLAENSSQTSFQPVIRRFDSSLKFPAHSSEVDSVEMSPVDDLIAVSTGTDDIPGIWDEGTVRLWDLGIQTAVWSKHHKSTAGNAAFSHDGRLVAYTADQKIFVVTALDGSPHRTLIPKDILGRLGCPTCSLTSANKLTFSPDGRYLAAGYGDALFLFDLETGNILHQLSKNERFDISSVLAITFTADQRFLQMIDKDHICIWDIATGQIHRKIAVDSFLPRSGNWRVPATSAAITTDSTYAVLGAGGNIYVFDMESETVVNKIPVNTSRVAGADVLAITHDECCVASAAWAGIASVFNIATGEELTRLEGPDVWLPTDEERFSAIAVRKFDGLIALGNRKGSIRLWRP